MWLFSGVLKQVWDLSDQDNDSMLSLREFCTALYFMERFREGRALPSTLPAGIHPDGSRVSAVAVPQGPGGQSAAVWRHIPGLESGELFHESVFELNCVGDRGGWDVCMRGCSVLTAWLVVGIRSFASGERSFGGRPGASS